MISYKLVVLDKNLHKKEYYFLELEEARLAMKEKVYNPAKQYIEDNFSQLKTLYFERSGKRQNHYENFYDYEIVSGHSYYALYKREDGSFIMGGAISEGVKYNEDEEDVD